uniref:Uncharacterized protein n=1 Tax=Lepeophtheirus salmonis TaxID=72036 RepID=A0A0K2TFY0_LEPSM
MIFFFFFFFALIEIVLDVSSEAHTSSLDFLPSTHNFIFSK